MVGNRGTLPFEEYVELCITYPSDGYTTAAPPREIDGTNSIGRCFEFNSPREGSYALAYCLQCPSFMVFLTVSTPAPLSQESREIFDGMVRSVDMRE
jgi:hypothetical protein